MKQSKIIIEVCAQSVESALAAQEGGADCVELCANLAEGGTTPSMGTLAVARQKVKIPIRVLLRPRGGDFLYSDIEYEVMKQDIDIVKKIGVDGIVIGILKTDGQIDITRCRDLINEARPLSVTFHRAFDMTADPFRALKDIAALGCDRILTSGQERDALTGSPLLAELVKRAGNRIAIMPGAGIDDVNCAQIIALTGAVMLHLTGQRMTESAMLFRNPKIAMGSEGMPEYNISATDVDRIRRVRKIVDTMQD